MFLRLDTGLLLALLSRPTPLHPWALGGIPSRTWQKLRAAGVPGEIDDAYLRRVSPPRTSKRLATPESQRVVFKITDSAIEGTSVAIPFAGAHVVSLIMPRWVAATPNEDTISQHQPVKEASRDQSADLRDITPSKLRLSSAMRRLLRQPDRDRPRAISSVSSPAHLTRIAQLLRETVESGFACASDALSGELGGREIEAALEEVRKKGDGRPLASLLGTGGGLTPAADDVMVGVLAACEVLSDFEPAVRTFRQEFVAELPTPLRRHTTAFSAQLIEAAIAGHFPEPLVELARTLCVVENGLAPTRFAAQTVLNIGNTSGLRWLEGFVTILVAVAR